MENNEITEMSCGSNFAYILRDNSSFLSTEYKVLQSQADSCFVKCMKMIYNGKIQLYYLTKDLKSFQVVLPLLNAENCLVVLQNLFADMIEVRANGFLSCQNIDISFDKIYLDPTTYKVSLVYLPVNSRIFPDDAAFENEFRTSLIKLISENPSLSSVKMTGLVSDLSNGMLTMEDLYGKLRGDGRKKTDDFSKQTDSIRGGAKVFLRMIAMNTPDHVKIDVTKDEFIIGKKKEAVDGVVTFNKMISRVHCKISHYGNQYLITDLQSANGTYVNRVRLMPNQPVQIKSGDIVRLANSDLQVIIT